MIPRRRTQTTIVPGQMHAPGGKNVPVVAITPILTKEVYYFYYYYYYYYYDYYYWRYEKSKPMELSIVIVVIIVIISN